MAYKALYRKWRPLTFDDVVGQEHITTTLKNELMNGRVAHAYLFCGTRGTGKTSTAKIFSRAINCPNSADGNPCNECEVCRGILNESVLDVVEMDAASNTGVEDIRRIIEDAMFLPTTARKKVYIIDEVHMISTSAFNALLKTLEEPPEHVVFILATTEYHKLPATVLSRCQKFDFRRITADDIAAHMKRILDKEGKQVDDEGIRLLAELGDGSMRDALSVLDGCLAYTDGALTYDDIIRIVGIADDDALYRIANALAQNDCLTAMQTLTEVVSGGKDVRAFVDMLVRYIRDVLVVKLTTGPSSLLTASQRRLERLSELAKAFTQEKLTYALEQLNTAVAQAKGSVFSTTVFELAVIKICDPSTDDSREALLDRIATLERRVEQGVPVVQMAVPATPAAPSEQPPSQSVPSSAPEAASVPDDAPAPVAPLRADKPRESGQPGAEIAAVMQKWDEIKLYLRKHGGLPLCSHLSDVKLKDLHGRLGIIFPNERAMNKNLVNRATNLELVTEAVKAVTGASPEVRCYVAKELGDDEPESGPADKLDALRQQFPDMEVIDE